MKTEKIVCVGGPLAGQTVTVNVGEPFFRTIESTGYEGVRTIEYRRVNLLDGRGEHLKQIDMFFIPDEPGEGLIQHLVKAYCRDR